MNGTIAIIDADLIGRSKHRFPNLVCMKLSSYYKDKGYNVELKLDYKNLSKYDKVFISKVFMDTLIPFESGNVSEKTEANIHNYYKDNPILNLPNVSYGGTGFYYDQAPALDYDIEHSKPDYSLYDPFVEQQRSAGVKDKDLIWYTDFSIGFTSRGCIRQCSFCVNRNHKKCELHSPLSEFVDDDRKYICLLDDNILASSRWKEVFDALIATGKPFQFRQGCDERLLTDEKCDYLFNKVRWYGDIIFAFDNIKDKDLIVNKLKMIRRHTHKQVRFYTFTAYNHDKPYHYDDAFYRNDIESLLERINILMSYHCLPYIMRYRDYENSPYRYFYTNIARWCNQIAFFKKHSFREFCIATQRYSKIKCSAMRALELVESNYPDLAEKYFDVKYTDYDGYGNVSEHKEVDHHPAIDHYDQNFRKYKVHKFF